MQQTKSKQPARRTLRLLSFNIQAGTTSARYSQYVTHSWRQVLPHTRRVENLDAISELAAPYDMVGLQEVDSGSLRSGFINQSRYLATHAGLPFWCHQSNRKVGKVAYAGNGFLSRYEPDAVVEHRLPGFIPGRGTLLIRYGDGFNGLDIAIVHLALGKRARTQQLRFLSRELDSGRHLVMLGDFNTRVDSPEVLDLCETLELQVPTQGLATYPSWQPQRAIDHILVSRSIEAREAEVLDVTLSDHCPVALEIDLPAGVELRRATHPVISVVSDNLRG